MSFCRHAASSARRLLLGCSFFCLPPSAAVVNFLSFGTCIAPLFCFLRIDAKSGRGIAFGGCRSLIDCRNMVIITGDGFRLPAEVSRFLQATGRTEPLRYGPCGGRTCRFGTVRYRRRWCRGVHRSEWLSGRGALPALHSRPS